MSLRRLIGAGAGVIFKGSGFYCNDYKSPTYQKQEKSESSCSSPDKASGNSTDKSSECKPACGSCCKNKGAAAKKD